MSWWRHVVSIVIGFIATVFGLRWLASQRRDDQAIIDEAKAAERRERKRIDALERLRHNAAKARLKEQLEELQPKPLDSIGVDDALAVLNGEDGGDNARPATDTERRGESDKGG